MKLRGQGAPEFSNASKTWAKPTTYYMRLYHDVVAFFQVGVVSFGGFSGEHGASERAQGAE